MSNSILWYATRGAGVVSLILLAAVIVLGVVSAMRWQTSSWPRFLTNGFHQNLALTTLVFLAIHIITAVLDPFTALGVKALVPFLSAYRTMWLGLGAVALYLLIAVALTSLLRPVFGYRSWRLIHWLTYAMWPIALVHGVGTGTDGRFTWMLAIDGLCVIGVLLAVLWRTSRSSPTAWRQLPASRSLHRSVIA